VRSGSDTGVPDAGLVPSRCFARFSSVVSGIRRPSPALAVKGNKTERKREAGKNTRRDAETVGKIKIKNT